MKHLVLALSFLFTLGAFAQVPVIQVQAVKPSGSTQSYSAPFNISTNMLWTSTTDNANSLNAIRYQATRKFS